MIRAAVLGPSGRMGRRVIELVAARSDMQVAAAIDHPTSPLIGKSVGGARVAGELAALAGCDAHIDFTTPEATEAAASGSRSNEAKMSSTAPPSSVSSTARTSAHGTGSARS